MIVRVLTARVSRANAGEFNELLRGQLRELREQDGLVYAKLARRLDQRDDEEVVLFEEWRTPADLWTWTGGQLGKPRLLPGTERLIDDLVITHYEALDIETDELGLTAIRTALEPRGVVAERVARESEEPGQG